MFAKYKETLWAENVNNQENVYINHIIGYNGYAGVEIYKSSI